MISPDLPPTDSLAATRFTIGDFDVSWIHCPIICVRLFAFYLKCFVTKLLSYFCFGKNNWKSSVFKSSVQYWLRYWTFALSRFQIGKHFWVVEFSVSKMCKAIPINCCIFGSSIRYCLRWTFVHLFFGIGIFQHFFVREESRRVFNFCQSPSIHLAVNIFDIRRSSQSSSSFISNMFFLSLHLFLLFPRIATCSVTFCLSLLRSLTLYLSVSI